MSVSSTGFADCLTRLDTIPKNCMRVKKPQEYEPGKLIFAMPKVKKAYWMSSFLVQFLALLQDTCLKRMSGLRCSFPNLCSLCSQSSMQTKWQRASVLRLLQDPFVRLRFSCSTVPKSAWLNLGGQMLLVQSQQTRLCGITFIPPWPPNSLGCNFDNGFHTC